MAALKERNVRTCRINHDWTSWFGAARLILGFHHLWTETVQILCKSQGSWSNGDHFFKSFWDFFYVFTEIKSEYWDKQISVITFHQIHLFFLENKKAEFLKEELVEGERCNKKESVYLSLRHHRRRITQVVTKATLENFRETSSWNGLKKRHNAGQWKCKHCQFLRLVPGSVYVWAGVQHQSTVSPQRCGTCTARNELGLRSFTSARLCTGGACACKACRLQPSVRVQSIPRYNKR